MFFPRCEEKILSPLPESHQHMEQPESFFGQSVFLIRAAIGTGLHAKNSIRNKGLKTGSQHAFRKLKVLLEFAETTDPIERIAKNEKRPAITNDRKRSCNRALLSF